MKSQPLKGIEIKTFIFVILVLTSFLTYKNQRLISVYHDYARYKLSNNKSDALSNMHRTISSAKEAGYVCKNQYLAGASAYQEITKRKELVSPSHSYTIPGCVQLPTGEIIVSINDGIARYYILLKVGGNNPETYHVLDIKGEALG